MQSRALHACNAEQLLCSLRSFVLMQASSLRPPVFSARFRTRVCQHLQDAKAAVSDPEHVSAKDRPEATFLPSLFADFLQTLLSIVPSNGG